MTYHTLPVLFLCFPLLNSFARVVSVQGEYTPIRSGKPGIQGAMPAGWWEDSAWADVDVVYGPQTVNPHGGDRSLRVEVNAVRSGRVQFRVPDVAVSPDRLIRLRVPLRSEDNRSPRVELRKLGPPYTSYWSATLPARPEWGEYEVLAAVAHTDPSAVLMFSLEGPGTLEIGDVRLDSLTVEEALADMDLKGNLLPNSSFPLGPTAPWASGANGTRPEHIRADPETPGPSGLPALRLETHRYEGRPMIQLTAPFTGRPGAVHTFSLWAKAEKPGMSMHLRMGPPSEALYKDPWQKTVSLTSEWRRYDLAVELPAAPDLVYLARVTSHADGVFWIDQVQVKAGGGDAPPPFERAGPVELTVREGRLYGLSFEDDPMPFTLHLAGDTGRVARVEGTVLDLYGVETAIPPIPVRDGSGAVRMEGEVPHAGGLGSFLLTLRAMDDGGAQLGRPAELLLHRVRRPRRGGEPAPDSPFGVHVAATPEWLATAKALGFNWNRIMYSLGWRSLQTGDGEWRTEPVSRMLDVHEAADVSLLTHFGAVPTRFSTAEPDWGGGSWYRTTAAPREDAMEGWETYCRVLLERAGDRLAAVEVWNEPFLSGFFVGDVVDGKPVRAEPARYAEMARRARLAAEAVGYGGRLLWNTGPHYGASERAFTQGVLEAGGAEAVDGLTIHRYNNSELGLEGDQFQRDLRVVREVFAGREAAASVWNSEGGHGLSEVFNLYRNVPPARGRTRAEEQAARYVRYVLSNFAAGVEKVFTYTWFPMDGWTSNYGYLNVDGRLSHIAPAASNLAWQLEGKRFVEASDLSASVRGQLYRGGTENTVVLIPRGGTARVPAGLEGVRLEDVYGNPAAAPAVFGPGVLYLSAPGLTLEMAAGLLSDPTP